MSDRAFWKSKLGLCMVVAVVCCMLLTASAHAQTTIFSDDFEDAFTGWTEGGTPDWYTGTPKNGTHSIRLRKAESIERTISTVGYESISVSFYMGAHSLDNANENVEATWYDGSGWNLLKRINNGDPEEDQQLHYFQYSLPASADDNSAFALKFKINGSGDWDYGYVDDVIVEGTSTGGGGEVLVYPDSWQTYGNASVTITSGSIADV
ncbi:MAG: hypothetical protein IMF16_03380, partial [Proteobacteria bacterium]|nr:hypothetical protein [Pseudomonadota bacterium]